MDLLIAGDIGGTKTTVGLFSPQGGPRIPLREATYRSADYASLEDICLEFTAREERPPRFGSFGVAGPVRATGTRLTNLPWVIETDRLSSLLSLERTTLINDLEAIARGIDVLEAGDIHRITSAGQINPGGVRAVMAPGTGLGESFMTWDGSRYRAHPSEGGHAGFAPGNNREAALLLYLLKQFDHVSAELVCSGNGIPHIYDFLKYEGHRDEPAWFAEKLSNAGDRTALILSTALEDDASPEICNETLNMFLSILGTHAGDRALTFMATGGLYLGGGILPRMVQKLEGGLFMGAFTNKGRFASVAERIPVSVILNPKVALMGAALLGLELMRGK